MVNILSSPLPKQFGIATTKRAKSTLDTKSNTLSRSQRANLIATVCDEVLKEHEGKVIETIELKKAMQSNSLRDKLLGWDNMDALDKVIIYLTIEKSAFEFDEVLSLLEKEGIKAEASVVKKSLERLVIAYILKRDGGLFSYRVPIMRETVLKTNEKGRRALLGELVGKI